MREIFAKRSDWLLHVGKLQALDVITIHPLDGLTPKMVAEAIHAQGLLRKEGGPLRFVIVHHGTRMFIQRKADVP